MKIFRKYQKQYFLKLNRIEFNFFFYYQNGKWIKNNNNEISQKFRNSEFFKIWLIMTIISNLKSWFYIKKKSLKHINIIFSKGWNCRYYCIKNGTCFFSQTYSNPNINIPGPGRKSAVSRAFWALKTATFQAFSVNAHRVFNNNSWLE